MLEKRARLCRLIRPANPIDRVNVFSQFTKRTTSLGLITIATVINKLWGWRVEVIDEENFRGQRDENGLPDHTVLQRENPADVVGFYTGLTSTIERVWDLARFYKKCTVKTLAGSWHAHYCPEETLRHNIDLIIHGDAEVEILKVLRNFDDWRPIHEGVGGASYIEDGKVKHILPNLEVAGDIPDCDERLVALENRISAEEMSQMPYPDFGLMIYARVKIYPIGRIRGCSMKCNFCTVKTKPHWASPGWLFGLVDWLVKTRKAKSFFIVDDRSEEDLKGTIEFFEMVAERYGRRLSFTVQMRLGAARNAQLLDAMRRAGVRAVCIGLESPIKEELQAMEKGLTAATMIELIKIWRKIMRVHGMFIFGFPTAGLKLTIAEKIKIYKKFIKKAKLDFVQVVLPVPLPGSSLRNDLEKAGKLFPLQIAPWKMYDANFVLIKPDKEADIKELQSAHIKIMAWFYGPLHFYKLICRTIIFPFDYLLRGWESWKSDWGRTIIRTAGHGIVKSWRKTSESEKHIQNLEKSK